MEPGQVNFKKGNTDSVKKERKESAREKPGQVKSSKVSLNPANQKVIGHSKNEAAIQNLKQVVNSKGNIAEKKPKFIKPAVQPKVNPHKRSVTQTDIIQNKKQRKYNEINSGEFVNV